MKLLDIINEGIHGFVDTFTPEQKERLLKKAKIIFKLFRKGTITRNDGVSFSYELGDNMSARVNHEMDLELFAVVEKMTELTYIPLNHRFMTELIENKFEKMFGVKMELMPPKEKNIIKFKGKKPWEDLENLEYLNEGRVGNMGNGITDKELSKVKILYTTFNKGFFKYDNISNYGYELPDDYYAYRDELGDVCIKMTGKDDQKTKFKFFSKGKFGSHTTIVPLNPLATGLEEWIRNKVKQKFERFNIKFKF